MIGCLRIFPELIDGFEVLNFNGLPATDIA
jgi:hypothetical protein